MWTGRLEPLIEELGATFFETTTAIAFADFAARGVEIAVVEVGLGGRLDSTNVVTPLVSVVTQIALDHKKYLGDTLEEIAREKAGIAKPGVPFVIGETRPGARARCSRREAAVEARIRRAARPTCGSSRRATSGPGPSGSAGRTSGGTPAVAHGMLMALPERFRPRSEAIEAGFAAARVPGRLDRRGRWLFDVAHNPDGMGALVAALRRAAATAPIHALVSILGDKEWPEMLVELDSVVDRGVLTVRPAAAGRRWDLAWLERWLARPDRPPARASWSLVPDFGAALARGRSEGAGTVLVTGSFHTVGDVMAAPRTGGLAWAPAEVARSVVPDYFAPCAPGAPRISRLLSRGTGLRAHIFAAWRRVAARYGFEEYDGPPLEPLELYTAKSGDEIVGQLYNFTDKGDRRGRAPARDDADAGPDGGRAGQRPEEADPLVLDPPAVPLRAAAARPAARALPAQLRPDRRSRPAGRRRDHRARAST